MEIGAHVAQCLVVKAAPLTLAATLHAIFWLKHERARERATVLFLVFPVTNEFPDLVTGAAAMPPRAPVNTWRFFWVKEEGKDGQKGVREGESSRHSRN